MQSSPHTKPKLTAAGLTLLITGQLMPQMDFSIVNVALDAISHSLNASELTLGLVVSLYGLAFSVFLAMSGRLGDRYGRKKLFLSGICLFAVASLFCGMAQSIHVLIAARVLQGIAAAMLMPQILATIHVSLSGERHSKAIGLYGSVGGLSFVIGQIVGGWLVSADLFGLGWRSVFYLNLPFCALILYFGKKHIPETKEQQALSLDWIGTLLFAAMVVVILTSISLGSADNWSWHIWSLLACTLPLGALLSRVEHQREAKQKTPLLPPSLIKERQFHSGILSLLIQAATYGGFMFVVALTLQSGFHWPAYASGNGFLGLGLFYFIGSLMVARLVAKMGKAGYRGLIILGALINLIGYATLYWVMTTYTETLTAWLLFVPMAITGLGNAFAVNSSIRVGLAGVEAKFAGVGSALMTTLQQAAIALGTALCGAFYTQNLADSDPFHLQALKAGLYTLTVFLIVLLIYNFYLIATQRAQSTQQSV
ncbi:Predicted arabinose efflux permease, MFS family [Vibrio xiamenensis]|uniref:Predicted arabinose efflux permease, MFS family n=1 Tax=Vibrio xiamenensis TaxID=861298 RepID=A0A1G7ZE38_9VIBR|nr:MFS transporter [Vibrio xiamenensis]SDH07013.1 Predicted arabinose efflux permease, MFS family [Vibrio xiamenensis]